MQHNSYKFLRQRSRRRGSVYLAVLGVAMIVLTLAVGGIMAARVQARSSDGSGDMTEARQAALSGLELARLWMLQDSAWRANRAAANGTWATNLAVGNGATVSISVVDPVDGNLTNRPHDPVTITATGRKGQAVQVVQQSIIARANALPCLRYAVHVNGQLRAKASDLFVGSATASTNGSLRNEQIIEGNVECGSITSAGIVAGIITSGVAPRALPDPTVAESYASLGTLITPSGNKIDKQVLSPGLNPWGAANPDGVYVIRTSSDVTISNSRINGTLVVICPGKTVTLSGALCIQTARSDYPALIVDGNLNLNFNSATSLSETTTGVNFNPTGAPYNNVTDGDTADTYPSEIWGLVHARGPISVGQNCTIRGALIGDYAGSGEALRTDGGDLRIVYDPALYTSPPQFYTTSVPMVPLAGSFRQVVN
jgi:hypothetical protein